MFFAAEGDGFAGGAFLGLGGTADAAEVGPDAGVYGVSNDFVGVVHLCFEVCMVTLSALCVDATYLPSTSYVGYYERRSMMDGDAH